MNLLNFSEESFIEQLQRRFPAPSPLLGIGDDCAIIPQKGKEAWLVTTDSLAEGTHFLPKTLSAYDLGYKSAMVNLSDIAAMGGTPAFAFLSLGLPAKQEALLAPFLDGLERAFKEEGVVLLGGDTVATRSDLFINLTVMGRAPLARIKRRASGKVGDLICVDGPLGDSAAGLQLLLESGRGDERLLAAHQRPYAHVQEGLFLSHSKAVRGMMDLSDGLATDLPKLCRACACGARIDLENLPLSEPFVRFCLERERDPLTLACEGGEEYCLLFTVEPSALERLQQRFVKRFDRPFWPIGHLTAEPGVLTYLEGARHSLALHPFQHFT